MRVVLAQLPHPSFPSRNVPLAAGFLKAYAHRSGLLDEAEVEILDPLDGDLSGCARLAGQILSRAPDVLGFSLYLWNVVRTLWVIERVKREHPRVKIVVGGPEVTPESHYILSRPEIDFAVTGEGELAFADLMRFLLCGTPPPELIPGLSCRRNGGWFHASHVRRIANLNEVPSPYLLGFIDPARYREMMLFTMRGCTLACKYCSWASRGRLRAFALERLRAELELAARPGGEVIVSVVDSALNTSPVFEDFCRMAASVNTGRQLKLNCFLQADRIDRATVELLKAAGFSGVEIGLQSAIPAVTSRVNRRVDLAAFLRGARLLEDGGIPAVVDVILGLPGDSPEGFEGTIGFATGHSLAPLIFNLSLGHGSALRRDAARFGAKAQDEPPFYVLETDRFTRQDLKTTLGRFYRYSADRDPLLSLRLPCYLRERPAPPGFVEAGQGARAIPRSYPVRNLVLCLDGPSAPLGWSPDLAGLLSASVGLNLRVYCEALPDDLADAGWLFEHLLARICRENPYITWDVHLDTKGVAPSAGLIDRIRSTLGRAPTFTDRRDELSPDCHVRRRSLNVFLHLPYDCAVGPDLRSRAQWIATARIDSGANLDGQVLRFLEAGPAGLLLDFAPGSPVELVRSVMALFRDAPTPAFFRDWVLERLWERDFVRVMPDSQTHAEVILDNRFGLAGRVFTEEDLLWEAVSRWRLRRPEYAEGELETLIEDFVANRIARGRLTAETAG